MQENDLVLLTEAAREAGEIARSFWREDPQVWDKGGNDPVSEADLAVDRHLKERLISARPDYGWVSEETEDDHSRLRANRVFIVDPIDGTRSFVKGEATWAHSLAVVENGIVTAGVVYLPVRDKLYSAVRSGGAALNGQKITSAPKSSLEGAEILSPKVTFQEHYWKSAPPTVNRHFRPSLAYRLALVGEGRFDGMITLRDAWEWDIAAGALIAEEAGATVIDRLGGPLNFNSPERKTAGVIAASAPIARSVLDALA